MQALNGKYELVNIKLDVKSCQKKKPRFDRGSKENKFETPKCLTI